MAIRSLKTGQFSRSTLVGNPVIMPGSYESIATVSVGSGGASSIEFTSIPATFTHLQIRVIGRTSSADDFRIQINSDTGSNYSRHLFYGTGSAAGTGVVNNDTKGNLGSLPSGSNIFCGYVVDILDYRNTNKYKTIRSLGGYDANGSGQSDFFSTLWMSTSAITSIKIYGQSYNFQQYSHAALYGVN